MTSRFVGFLVLFAFFGLSVHGMESSYEGSVEEGNDRDASMREMQQRMQQQNMFTSCMLPKYTKDVTVPAGETVDVLIGLSNLETEDSERWYRAEYAVAYLFNPDPAFHVQNFTGVAYNRTVLPGETATLNYRIRPDPRVEPKHYHLVIQLFYMNERNETFLTTPFNSTIQISDGESSSFVDITTVGSYALILAVFAAGAFVPCRHAWMWLVRHGYLQKQKRKNTSTTSSGRKSAKGELVVNPHSELDWTYVPHEHRQFVKESSQQKQKESNKQQGAVTSNNASHGSAISPTLASSQSPSASSAKKKKN